MSLMGLLRHGRTSVLEPERLLDGKMVMGYNTLKYTGGTGHESEPCLREPAAGGSGLSDILRRLQG